MTAVEMDIAALRRLVVMLSVFGGIAALLGMQAYGIATGGPMLTNTSAGYGAGLVSLGIASAFLLALLQREVKKAEQEGDTA